MAQSKAIVLAIRKFFTRINEPLTIICGIVFFLYMLNIMADVTGRYLFLKPVQGTVEIGENVLAFAVFLSLAAVQMRKGHIRVNILESHLSPELAAWFEIFTLAIGFSMFGLMTWQGFTFAIRSWQINELGINLPIPLYIGKFALFIGSAMFCIQFFIDLIDQIHKKFGTKITASKEVKS